MRISNKDLSDWVYTGPSNIHGTGLFAKRELAVGEYIGTYGGPEAKRDGTYVLWVYNEDGSTTARSGRNLLRYLNHAQPGNVEFDGFDLYARIAVPAGEELTFDYSNESE